MLRLPPVLFIVNMAMISTAFMQSGLVTIDRRRCCRRTLAAHLRPRALVRLVTDARRPRAKDREVVATLSVVARQKKRKDGAVHITAVSAEALIQDRPLSFEPPLMERAPNPDAFVFWWRMLQYVFPDLVDPRTFSPLAGPLEANDLAVCLRYVAAAEEFAESQLLGADDEMTVRLDDDTDTEHVEAIVTSKEITRGFSALLRQFDAKEEPASFQIVSGRLRRASMATTDGMADERCALIDAWRTTQGRLHAVELKRLVRRKVDPQLEYGNDHPPNYYLSAYHYGDFIHWDSKRDVIAVWETDPFHKHHERLAFLEAAAGLAHLYVGFSELVRTAIGK